jgi:hypothetical protein
MCDRPLGQQEFQPLYPGRGGQAPGQVEQVEQPLVGERPVRLGEGNAEDRVGELRRHPGGRAEQPSGDRVRLGRGQPLAEQPGAAATGGSQSSRLFSAPDASTIACRQSPGAAITPAPARMAASGWTSPPGVCPVARSNSWKLASALGGSVSGRIPVRWYRE